MPCSPATSSNRLGSAAAAAAVSGGHTSSRAAAPWQLPGLCRHLQCTRKATQHLLISTTKCATSGCGTTPQQGAPPLQLTYRQTRHTPQPASQSTATSAPWLAAPDSRIRRQRVVGHVNAGHPHVPPRLRKAAAVHQRQRPCHLLPAEAAGQLLHRRHAGLTSRWACEVNGMGRQLGAALRWLCVLEVRMCFRHSSSGCNALHICRPVGCIQPAVGTTAMQNLLHVDLPQSCPTKAVSPAQQHTHPAHLASGLQHAAHVLRLSQGILILELCQLSIAPVQPGQVHMSRQRI